jgi:hypothetical protein
MVSRSGHAFKKEIKSSKKKEACNFILKGNQVHMNPTFEIPADHHFDNFKLRNNQAVLQMTNAGMG